MLTGFNQFIEEICPFLPEEVGSRQTPITSNHNQVGDAKSNQVLGSLQTACTFTEVRATCTAYYSSTLKHTDKLILDTSKIVFSKSQSWSYSHKIYRWWWWWWWWWWFSLFNHDWQWQHSQPLPYFSHAYITIFPTIIICILIFAKPCSLISNFCQVKIVSINS